MRFNVVARRSFRAFLSVTSLARGRRVSLTALQVDETKAVSTYVLRTTLQRESNVETATLVDMGVDTGSGVRDAEVLAPVAQATAATTQKGNDARRALFDSSIFHHSLQFTAR